MQSKFSVYNSSKSKLYVFDFDGTITYFDTFRLFLLIRMSSTKYWKEISIELLRFLKHKDKYDFRVKLQEIVWNDPEERGIFFKRIIKSNFFRLIIRDDVFTFFKKIVKKNKVLVITANEKSLVKTFLDYYFVDDVINIDIIGSQFNIKNSKLIK